MNRADVDNILRIGIIILIIAMPSNAELERTDWKTLNATFVPIHNSSYSIGDNVRNITFNIDQQILEDFESQYYGYRAEGMNLGDSSPFWVDTALSDPTQELSLRLAETEGNEWQDGNTVAFLNDSNESEWYMVTREQNTAIGDNYGHAQSNDYWQVSIYNATGGGTYGCLYMMSNPSANGNAVVLINGGYFIAVDGASPTVIGEATMGVWHTIRLTAIYPSYWNLTIDGITYGQYSTYGNSWSDEEGHVRAFTLGTLLGTDADTCTEYVDNVTNSWETTNKVSIYEMTNTTQDHPALVIDTGESNIYWKDLGSQTDDASSNLVWKSDGKLSIGYSSEKYKTNIANVTSKELELFNKLRPARYTFTSTGRERYGLIAEEVGNISKLLADYDNNKAVNINTNAILSLTIAKVQDLEARLNKICTNHPEVCK